MEFVEADGGTEVNLFSAIAAMTGHLGRDPAASRYRYQLRSPSTEPLKQADDQTVIVYNLQGLPYSSCDRDLLLLCDHVLRVDLLSWNSTEPSHFRLDCGRW